MLAHLDASVKTKQSKQYGFTIIEVIIILVISTILASVFLPFIKDIVYERKVNQITQGIRDSLKLAQNHALTHKTSVFICNSYQTEKGYKCDINTNNWTQNLTLVSGDYSLTKDGYEKPSENIPPDPKEPEGPKPFPKPEPPRAILPPHPGGHAYPEQCQKDYANDKSQLDNCMQVLASVEGAHCMAGEGAFEPVTSPNAQLCAKQAVKRLMTNYPDFKNWVIPKGEQNIIVFVLEMIDNGTAESLRSWHNAELEVIKQYEEAKKRYENYLKDKEQWEKEKAAWDEKEKKRYEEDQKAYEEAKRKKEEIEQGYEDWKKNPAKTEFTAEGQLTYRVNDNQIDPNKFNIVNQNHPLIFFDHEGMLKVFDESINEVIPVKGSSIRIGDSRNAANKAKIICISVLGKVEIIKGDQKCNFA